MQNCLTIHDQKDAIECALRTFENKMRGMPQAHIASQLMVEIRASIETAVSTVEETPADVLKALVDFQNIYGKNALDPKGMPGNDMYREMLIALVERARFALGMNNHA